MQELRAGRDVEQAEDDLVDDLGRLGVASGGILLVQSSLRRVGPVPGGAETVVRALRRALGPDGTLLAYTATPENSRSSSLHRAAVRGLDAAARKEYVRSMPGFHPGSTACSPTMGRLAETIRTTPGALRSDHPQTSFAALGARAGWIVGEHPLESHLGDRSPLGRLYQADGTVLLLGVPLSRCTCFHLAEYRVPGPPVRMYECARRDDGGESRWITFTGVDLDDRRFAELGAAVEQEVPFGRGTFGLADSLLVPIRPAVDAAVGWLGRH